MTRSERRKALRQKRSLFTRGMVIGDLRSRGIKVDATTVTIKAVPTLAHDDGHIHAFAPPSCVTESAPIALADL